MNSELELVDSFRQFHPNLRRFSWRKKSPFKQARFDYFLTSKNLTDLIDSCEILPSYRSDHSILKLEITINHFKIGCGIWKFNNSLLKNQEYLGIVNRIIEEEKLKYCPPVYSHEYIKENFDNITFTISDESFLEMLFLRIRGETIKFATHLKRKQNQEENLLRAEIDNLESSPAVYLVLLERKKAELENIRKGKINGQIIRARIQWLNEAEKPSTFFCKLENKHFVEKTIRKLHTNTGSTITDQVKILTETENFYKSLFKKDESLTENLDITPESFNSTPKSACQDKLGDPLSTKI